MNETVQNKEVMLAPASMPMSRDISEEFGLSQSQWRVLVDQIFPNAKTQEAVAMALAYCRTRKLDVFKRPVHIVPMYSAALKKEVETVWPGISEVRTTAARTGEYAGIDEVVYGPEVDREFTAEKDRWENRQKVGTDKVTKKVSFPKWASVIVYRWVKGEKAAFHTKIFWEETYATQGKLEVPNAMWAKRPYGQIDKCVEAAALRKAFPEELGNIYAAEEMEGRELSDGVSVEREVAKPKHQPPRPTTTHQASEETRAESRQPVTIEHEDKTRTENEVDDSGHEEEPVDVNTYFERFDEAMAVVSDLASLEEVWTEFDPMAHFDGKPNAETNQGIAKAIRKRAEKRIGGAA
jgi:phage recombination protein Bet